MITKKFKFQDIVVGEEGLLKGPFGSDLKKSLYVPKSENTYKVYLQENILKKDKSLGKHYISAEYFHKSMKRYKVSNGDFIVTCDGTLGEIFQLKDIEENGIISSSLLRITLNKAIIDDVYFPYFWLSRIKYPLIRSHDNSVLKHLPGVNAIRKFQFDLPELEDQQKIASVLSTLDAKIELNNKINAELEAMAKTLYDYWFVQFDFPDENGKPYKSSGGKMVWSEELKREIPEGWEVKKLDQIESNIVTGKTPSTKIPEYFNGEVPFICIGDVRGNMHIVKTELTLTQSGADSQKNKYIPKGSICVTCIASPGLVAFATEQSQTNQQLNSIVCEHIENRYYLYFYLTDYFKYAKAKTGNTFANMNKDDFSSILVLKPSNNLLKIFTEKVNSLIEKILVNSEENQKLVVLRDWLLPMLMNGQVKVS